MEIEDRITVDTPRDVIVSEMQEPEVLQRTIPNCKNAEKTEDKKYTAEVSESISMVSIDMEIEIEITEYNPPDSFAVAISGTAPGSNTNVDATASFDLSVTDDGTEIDMAFDITVTGKLASLGFRMLKSTVTKRLEEMTANIEAEFAEATPQ